MTINAPIHYNHGWYSAKTDTGDNDTLSRPLVDLRGVPAPCAAFGKAAVCAGLRCLAKGNLIQSQHPGAWQMGCAVDKI